MAYVVATATIKCKKRLFFPICMGMRAIHIKMGAVLPSVKVDWMLAAVFGDIKESNLLSVEVTSTLFYWVWGIEARAQMEREDQEKVPDIIEVGGVEHDDEGMVA